MNEMTVAQKLAATAHAMGQQPTPEGIAMIEADISGYPAGVIDSALQKMRRKNMRFCTASIIDFIQKADGRPSVDSAWSLMPKDESETAVVTKEMLGAWSVAWEQYYAKDVIGAQISFKREYQRLVDEARENGVGTDWIPSLGHDNGGRDSVLIEAAIDGKLLPSHVHNLISDESYKALAIATKDENLLMECKKEEVRKTSTPPESHLEELSKSKLGRKFLSDLKNSLS